MSGPSDVPSPRKHDPYGPWRNRDFQLYAASWFLIVFANQVEAVAVGIYIYGATQSYLALGLTGLVRALPVLVLCIAGGQLADRFDRQRILIVTLMVSSLAAVGLWWFARTGGPVAWVYVFLGIGATTLALGSPSRAALLPQIVGTEQLSTAITWSSSIFQIATMVGPAVGGLILGATQKETLAGGTNYHAQTAFLVVLVCRLCSLAATAGLRHRPTTGTIDEISWKSLIAGIRFVGRNKPILATITLDMVAVLLAGFTYLLPVFAEDILKVGARGLGFLRSAEAIGAVSMAVALAHLPPMRRAGRSLLLAVAGYGLCTVIFGLSRSYALSLLAMFFIGAMDNISVVVRHTLVQLLTPDAMRGRVSAVNTIFIVASNDLGGFESGLSAALFTPVLSVVLGGLGAMASVVACGWTWPQLLRIGALSDVRPDESTLIAEETETELSSRS